MGAIPIGGLVRDAAGNLYGTAFFGGSDGVGVVFKMDLSSAETLLHNFTNSPDGAYPDTDLLRDTAGNLYGTTAFGGSFLMTSHATPGTIGAGTVFKIDPSGTESLLYDFNGPPSDGNQPSGGLLMDAAGNLYGPTFFGAPSDLGTVFEIDLSGTESMLHGFVGSPDDGAGPSGLIMDRAGNFYSTTSTGGCFNAGTVFKLDPSGKLSVLYSFTGSLIRVHPMEQLRREAWSWIRQAISMVLPKQGAPSTAESSSSWTPLGPRACCTTSLVPLTGFSPPQA